MSIFFAAVADDHPGAIELAGALADRGMRPILILDELWRQDFETSTRDADAVVIATTSRIAQRDAAYEQTRRAVRLLAAINPQLLQVKYSSSFAPAEANIGASIDAAMDETHQEFTVAFPDFSRNRQTATPQFLAQLQTQTHRRLGLASFADTEQALPQIRERLAKLRTEGVEIAILDVASEESLRAGCQAISDLHLVTGSSALAMHLPTSWVQSTPVYPQRRTGGRGFLVISGTDSPVTHGQNAWLAAHHAVAITLDAMNLATGAMPDSVLTPICEELASGGTCLLQTHTDIRTLHEFLRQQNKTRSEAAESIARSLATFVRDVMSLITPEGLIVADEETATALSRVLRFGALAVGPNIEPGIPVAVTLSESALPVVLKPASGGTESFYLRAIETIRGLQYLGPREEPKSPPDRAYS